MEKPLKNWRGEVLKDYQMPMDFSHFYKKGAINDLLNKGDRELRQAFDCDRPATFTEYLQIAYRRAKVTGETIQIRGSALGAYGEEPLFFVRPNGQVDCANAVGAYLPHTYYGLLADAISKGEGLTHGHMLV